MPRACPFYANPANTVEHVEPQWLSRYYRQRGGSGSFTMSFGDLYPTRTVPTLNQTVKVCGACNSGWMSNLERRAKTGVLLLAEGEPTTLGPEGQKTLTRWLLKGVIVREQLMPVDSDHRISVPEQRRVIAQGGIPEGWLVHIGAFEGIASTYNYQMEASRLRDKDGKVLGWVALHTYRLECFVGQVLLHSLAESPSIRDLLGGPPYAIEIPLRSDVSWPPPAAFSPETIETVQKLKWLDTDTA